MDVSRRTLGISSVGLAAGLLAASCSTGKGDNKSGGAGGTSGADQDVMGRFARQRAVEAVIWSMPALVDVFLRESLFTDFGMRPGDVAVMGKPLVARHEVLTVNSQVNYCLVPYDLSNGPVVVEIPASSAEYALIGEFCDNWQAPLAMIGSEGPDRGKGGRYLLLPPGHTEPAPAGYLAIQFEGFRGTMVYRPVFTGKGTMEGAIALARGTKVYPLAQAANPAPTRVIDPWDKAWHSLPVYDHTYFEKLAKFITDEPIRERDKAIVGTLSAIGIEADKPFAPDAAMIETLDAAAKEAYDVMQHGFVTPGQALTPFWPDSQWTGPNPAYQGLMGANWSYETAGGVWTYQRAVLPFFWASYLPQKLGGEQMYLMGIRDKSGKKLSGKGRYRLRVSADVPVDKFWSLVLYSMKTKSFVPNELDRAGVDSYASSGLQKNSDGSVDIYLGEKPDGPQSNWLPAGGEDFFVIFRLYGPQKAVYDKTWRMPDIEAL